ncbi:MAG: group I intron-associated PD-(D/E)XK endonuclease, partial [Candidatus Woesebacteria bacterium]|nr:group I intron-associated PD-(D/E)XK endonuclease [Candidatus Woesebacteria bacterium]
MTSPTTIKGEMACIEVEKRAIQKGAIVSRPNLETRYDRIIDWKGKLYRAQIKWCDRKRSASEGSVVVKAIGVSMGKSTKKYSENEVDLIFAYIPKTSK